MKPHYARKGTPRAAEPNTTGRITAIEGIAATAVIALIGAVAAGWFDAMVPWK